MVAKTSFQPGTPSWVDLASPDVEASAAFYGSLFGWDLPEGPPEVGGYRRAMLGDAAVAGLGPQFVEGQPAAWLTYITVADADQTAKLVAENGGTVVMEPMDVLTFGRMAVFTDPVGAAVAVWQPRDHIGAGRVNEPGTLMWNELRTRDAAAATTFYGDVFGWRAEAMPMGAVDYTILSLEEVEPAAGIGGLLAMDDNFPADVPAHWTTTFGVADCDDTAARCAAAGGSVVMPAMDMPIGRYAVLADLHGAQFGIMELAAT